MNTTMSFRLPLAVIVIATALTACQPAAEAPSPSAPEQPAVGRIAGRPDFNGVWQAIGTAYWNIEDHSASGLSEFWQLGAIAAIPAGQSVVEGGTIPYLPAAIAKTIMMIRADHPIARVAEDAAMAVAAGSEIPKGMRRRAVETPT